MNNYQIAVAVIYGFLGIVWSTDDSKNLVLKTINVLISFCAVWCIFHHVFPVWLVIPVALNSLHFSFIWRASTFLNVLFKIIFIALTGWSALFLVTKF